MEMQATQYGKKNTDLNVKKLRLEPQLLSPMQNRTIDLSINKYLLNLI